jgi:hypothetical protein
LPEEIIEELVKACEASFMDHYSVYHPAPEEQCDCGAAQHNAMLRAVIAKAKGLAGV